MQLTLLRESKHGQTMPRMLLSEASSSYATDVAERSIVNKNPYRILRRVGYSLVKRRESNSCFWWRLYKYLFNDYWFFLSLGISYISIIQIMNNTLPTSRIGNLLNEQCLPKTCFTATASTKTKSHIIAENSQKKTMYLKFAQLSEDC